jgi:ATP-binding cassette subfamily B protein
MFFVSMDSSPKPPPEKLVAPVLRVFWQQVRSYKAIVFFIAICIVAADLSQNVLLPWLNKQLLNTLFLNDRTDTGIHALFVIAALMIGTKLFSWSMYRGMGFMTTSFQTRVMHDLQENAFAYLMRHSYQFFLNAFAGSLVKRVNRLASSFEDFADTIEFNVLPLITTLLGTLLVLASINRGVAGIFVIWIAVFLSLNILFSRWRVKFDIERAARDSEATGALADAIGNHTTVLSFAGNAHEESIFAKALSNLRRARVRSWNLAEFNFFVHGLITVGVEALILYVSLRLWRENRLTVGDFILFQSYFMIIVNKLRESDRIIRRFYSSFSDAKEMVDILDTPHEIKDLPKAKQLKATEGEIEFDRVSFAYQARQVMEDFSLTIGAGEKVAFIGSSGAGKTTIVKLLMRFYDPQRGKILIDGQPIAKVTQDSLHAQVSLVPQEPVLFHRSLLDNIRYGRRDATEEEVIIAAKQAHCHEFIQNLAEGYQTFVGERGVKLSGGERQRIAIARAILKNAPILILDEATSSLDSESEALIQDALETLMKGKTVIAIAHRLSTIMRMDRILVIEHGRVSDEGTHEELLQKKGIYQKLWNIQAKGFKAKK